MGDKDDYYDDAMAHIQLAYDKASKHYYNANPITMTPSTHTTISSADLNYKTYSYTDARVVEYIDHSLSKATERILARIEEAKQEILQQVLDAIEEKLS